MTDRYICSTTRIRVRLHQMPAFLLASFLSAVAARRTPGNVRVRLLGFPPLPWFHTLTVWESEEAMAEFVKTPAHRRAMAGMEAWSARGSFARFTARSRWVGWRSAFRALRTPSGVYRRGEGFTRPAGGTA